ncbi:hypothetical protein BH09DEP1_BH09DEP1_2590 [soil metagenome]
MKNMNLRSIFLIIATLLGVILPTARLYAPNSAPQLSEEDVKFLEDLGKQIQKEVEQLPSRDQLRAQGMPEDQVQKANTKEKFDEDVKRYSSMSEEDLFAEMEKALAEVEKAGTPEATPEYPSANIYQGEQESQPVAPVVQKPSVPSNKQQAAIQMIDALLASITRFLSKAQAMVELSGKIPSWVKEGKLRNWPATLTWNSFRAQVEELQAKLNKIKDKDSKTGTYKYLDELIKEDGAYNNLVRLKENLAKSEPQIELGSFAIDKMSGKSRQAIRDTLTHLHEAVVTMGISASLDKIIEKYDPTAKKIKESEEAAQKRASEESRRGRTPGYTTVGGYPKGGSDSRGRYDFDRGGGAYSPGLFDAPAREKEREDSKKNAKAGAGGGAAGGKADAKKPEDKKPGADKPKREEDKTALGFVNKFNDGLYEFQNAIEENKNLSNIEKHMADANPVDAKLVDEAKNAIEGIRNAERAARRLKGHLSKLSKDQQKEYKKDIRESFKIATKDVEKILKQLDVLDKPLGAGALLPGQTAAAANLRKTKNFAYFGKKDEAALRDVVAKNKKEIAAAQVTAAGAPLPQDVIQQEIDTKKLEELLARENLINLNDLREKIKDLQKIAKEF